MHQTTISFHTAQQVVASHKQQAQATKLNRVRMFQEFKSTFCDLLDGRDWAYYVEQTGLKLSTLLRFARYHAAPVERVFAQAPGANYFEPLNVRTGQLVDTDYQATKARPHLLEYLRRENPGWQFVAAPSIWAANE